MAIAKEIVVRGPERHGPFQVRGLADGPTQEHTIALEFPAPHGTVIVTACARPSDGVPVLFIDTDPRATLDAHGAPQVRVWLNDGLVFPPEED